MILCCVLAASTPAFAFAYTDADFQLRIEIPESDATYYYTPDAANLFEDLLEQVESSGRDVRLLVRTYAPSNALGYSLEITSADLPVETPASGTAPAGGIYRDAQLLTSGEKADLASYIRQVYEGRFNLSEPRASAVRGLPSLRMDGTGIENTGWDAYDIGVDLVATEMGQILSIALITEHDDAQGYKRQGNELLSSMEFGEPPAPEDAQLYRPSASPEAAISAATVVPSETAAAAPEQAPEESAGSFQSFGSWVADMWEHNRLFVLGVLAGLIALVGLIVALCLRHAHRTRSRGAAELAYTVQDDDGNPRITRRAQQIQETARPVSQLEESPETGGSDTRVHTRVVRAKPVVLEAGAEEQENLRETLYDREEDTPSKGKIRNGKETDMVASGGYNGREYDFSEDISRYTQQPSADVNDVSRYTHGYGASREDEGLDRLKDAPVPYSAAPRPTVGSRVAKNKTRRRRSR